MKRRFFGCRIVQRNDPASVPLFLFHVCVRDIREWAGIRRIDEHEAGTQRILRPTRVSALVEFMRSNTRNTVPTSVLLAFQPGETRFHAINDIRGCVPDEIDNQYGDKTQWGVLEFDFTPEMPEHLRPALIVDGQHRIMGLSGFQDEDVPVMAVGLLDATIEEQAFQFIVVNNKAVKVPAENVKAVIAEIPDEEGLRDRLLKARVRYGTLTPALKQIDEDEESPFRRLLAWPSNREGERLVPLTAIEQALKTLQGYFPALADDEDSTVEILEALWRAVRAAYPEQWGHQGSKLMSKVGLLALHESLAEALKALYEFGYVNIFESREVEDQAAKFVAGLPQEFWAAEWTVPIQDNANVRKKIREDIALARQNQRQGRPWHQDLELPHQIIEPAEPL